jgi:hypothetical protein
VLAETGGLFGCLRTAYVRHFIESLPSAAGNGARGLVQLEEIQVD